jgi:hypothetical protein
MEALQEEINMVKGFLVLLFLATTTISYPYVTVTCAIARSSVTSYMLVSRYFRL